MHLRILIGVLQEVVYRVCQKHHLLGFIGVVVVLAQFPVNIQAVMGNGPQLESDLAHKPVVFLLRQLPPARVYVNQPSDQSAVGIRHLYFLVGCHKQKTSWRKVIALLSLLVHQHRLMADQAVELRVVRDPRKIPVHLQCNQRIAPELLKGKCVAVAAEAFCVEHLIISGKQFLYNLEDRSLAGSGFAVQDNEFLDLLAVPGDHSADGPFKLLQFRRLIQCSGQLLPGVIISALQFIRELSRQVLLRFHFVNVEADFVVQLHIAVRKVADVGLVFNP